jgi:hypothetical protein
VVLVMVVVSFSAFIGVVAVVGSIRRILLNADTFI